MITNCIVSAFAQLKKAAVLFELNLRNSWSKCLLLSSALLAPALANAALELNNWWGANNAVVKSANDCNSVYSIKFNSENAGIFQLIKDGVGLTPTNLVLTSDVASTFNFEAGSDGQAYGLRHSGDAETVQLYLISGKEKDTLSYELPTYGLIGATGVDYQNMLLTTEPTFTAHYCSATSSEAPSTATWQWQLLDKTTGTWSDIADATTTDYAPGASVLTDSANIRVVMIDGSDSLISSALVPTYATASVGYEVIGTDIFATTQQPTYENEIDYGSSFTVNVTSNGSANITEYKIITRSDNEEAYQDFMSLTAPDNVFNITPSRNLEYKIIAVGTDLRPGREGDPVTLADSFFVRVRYKWDDGAIIDTMFNDNFGTFKDDNDYLTCDGREFTDSLTAIDSSKNVIVNYWAADYYNSVKNHKFAILNPLAGPFSGDCASDGWSHYACWDDGACDGYRVEDGYYAILPNPDYSNCGRPTKDYWNGYDHTYEVNKQPGGMMFVNCAAGSQHTVLLERQITLDNACENTRLLFTAYVNNATSVSTNKPVNVRLIVRDADSTVIYETPSGNIYPRSMSGGQWANLSFMFNAAKGGKYTLQVVNNQQGGAADAGNDLLFDDICITAAYPVVNVYRNRSMTDATPVDTCDEVDVPLYVLCKEDIKKYITNPIYLYQYSKDTVNWVSMGTFTDVDSFVVSLRKADPTFWDTTYFRGFAASNESTITKLLAGEKVELTCDNVYALSSPFRVVFDYSGPLSATVYDTLCAGEKFNVKLSSFKRPVYRWVDSYTKEAISTMDTTFSYEVKATDPVDTLFYFVTEQRLGCTDTMQVRVHRRLYVDFNTPENFVVCLYDTAAHLTDVFPATGTKFTWKSGDYSTTTDVAQLTIPESLPLKGTFSVLGEADDYCSTTKSFPYDVHKPITVSLAADRTDSLFCLGSATTEFKLTANTLTGAPTTYYWTYDGTQVASTTAPTNSYSFGSLTEGKHEFGVKVVDEVCNVTGKSEFSISNPIEVREPITISMTADTAICEDATATAQVTLQHLLNADGTEVRWSLAAENGTLANTTTSTADQKSSNVITPVSTTATTEPMVIFAAVSDKVCTDNNPLANATVKVYKKLDVTVSTDRSDSLFCMSGNTGITFTATTNRGYVYNYNWYADDALVATTGHNENTYTFPVTTEGKHVYAVHMSDGVCNTVNGGELEFEVPIETRLPITMSLAADPTFCEDATLPVNVSFEHLKADPTTVTWTVSENGKLQSATTATEAAASSNVVTPNSSTNAKETVTVTASVDDKVCPQNSPVTKTVTSELHKLIKISLAADDLAGVKCLSSDIDYYNGLTVTVEKGDPTFYTWSDGDTTYTPVHQYKLALGDNVITAYAYDPVCVSAGAAAEASVSVTTRQPLELSLTQTAGSNPACVNSSITATASVANAFPGDVITYQWSPENGSNPSITLTTAVGENPIYVVASTDNNICPSQSKQIDIYGQDSVKIAISAPSGLCQLQDTSSALVLDVNVISGNPQMFIWSTGDTTYESYLTVYPTASQSYSVYAVDAVCANSFAISSPVVAVSNMYTLQIEALEDEVQMETAAEFSSVVPEGIVPSSLTWYTNYDSTGVAPLGYYAQVMPYPGNYTFYAVADGGYCGLIHSNEVEIDVADYYQVPTAFTPYNDNPKNNVFMKGYTVEIFNRYQQLVFEGNDGWDGYYNGKLADPGTYFYRLRKKDGRQLKGTIELVKF